MIRKSYAHGFGERTVCDVSPCNGIKREKRFFDKNGDKEKDVHYTGPPNHEYPHEHYWYKDSEGNWHRTTYDYWRDGGRGWKA